MSDGFLGRWSRRKLDAKEGKPLPPESVPGAEREAAPAVASLTAALPEAPPRARPEPAAEAADAEAADAAVSVPGVTEEAPPAEPPPTLEDVRALTAQSDFRRFAARDVAPEVKNAAMKKLFTDPHYNIMDGMDVYIGDYSKPDPIPDHMLRQLAGAAFLRLFDEAPSKQAQPTEQLEPAHARDVADNPGAQSVAQSADSAAVPETHDAHPDLRLQQDDAPPGADPGQGAV